MATTTSNFSWPIPQSTDLVKDGATAIASLGSGIDTSMADLKGGTTGQVLKKNSNTDMDFVWSADSAGMTNPMTTTGDTIYSSSGSTPARLGIGTTGQVLTVNGGVPTWATPAGGGKILQVVTGTTTTATSSASSTYIDTTLTASITPSSASSKVLVLVTQNGMYKTGGSTAESIDIKTLRDATAIQTNDITMGRTGTNEFGGFGTYSVAYLDSPATTSSVTYKTQFRNGSGSTNVTVQRNNALSSIVLLEVGA